ncbi:unnamed protein product [Sphagnum tenellum]
MWQQEQLHHHTEKKRKVSQEELATTGLCAPAIALYCEELLQYTVALLLPRLHWIEPTQQLEITAIVSFSVLFVSVYCLLVLTTNRQPEKAMQLFQQMQQEGMSPEKFAFIQVMKACAGLGALENARLVHEQLIQSGCKYDVFVGSSLVDMTKGTGTISTNATRSVVAVEEGRRVHDQIIQSALESVVFLGNSLHDMYAKCGSIEDASVPQDAISRCGHLDHHTWRICHSWAWNLCENVEQQRKQRGVKKLLGHTQIEVSNEVRTMNVVDNEYHPCRTAEIVRALA